MSDYAPGTRVEWLDTATGLWHPGVVKFDCCHASAGGPFTQVEDEVGWWHTMHADQMRPRGARLRATTRKAKGGTA